MSELKPRRLKQVRFNHDMSKAQLSRLTGIQAGVIGWIESGRFIPYDSQLDKIADALGVDDPQSLLEPLEVG